MTEDKRLEIYKYGSSILRETMPRMEKINDDILELIQNMHYTMYEEDGIGLSANQVGAYCHLCIIGASLTEESNLDDFVVINGKVLESSGSSVSEEGCLSFPEIREDVIRPETIVLQYQDENLDEYTKEFDGLIARVIQHEIDHLNGVYFIDRISPISRKLLKKQLSKIAETQKHHI